MEKLTYIIINFLSIITYFFYNFFISLFVDPFKLHADVCPAVNFHVIIGNFEISIIIKFIMGVVFFTFSGFLVSFHLSLK